jgi:hypothetical protein
VVICNRHSYAQKRSCLTDDQLDVALLSSYDWWLKGVVQTPACSAAPQSLGQRCRLSRDEYNMIRAIPAVGLMPATAETS